MSADLTGLPRELRWRGQQYPQPVVLAVVTGRGPGGAPEYLLIRRAAEPYVGLWGLVGGKWEFGEELETAVLREIREETGIAGRFAGLGAVVTERVRPADHVARAAHFLLFVCRVAVDGTPPAIDAGEGQSAWFTARRLARSRRNCELVAVDAHLLRWVGRPGARLRYLEAEVRAGSGPGAAHELLQLTQR